MSSEPDARAAEPEMPAVFNSGLMAELREARLEIVRLQSMISEFASRSVENRAELVACKSREEVFQQQIRDLRGSLSWRITLPVRMTRRLLAGSARERGQD